MSVNVGLPALRQAGMRSFRPTLAALAMIFVGLWVLVAVFAPLISPDDPSAVDLSSAYAPSSGAHLLGADASGRDILSRLIWGARSAILGPFVVVVIAGALAVVIALTAALFRGWFDQVASRVLDLIFAFPGILLALVGVALFGAGLTAAVGALSIAYIPYIARVVRGDALRQTSLAHIQVARLNGVSTRMVALKHLVPNLAPLIIGQVTLSFGYAMVDLAAISFLGLGIQEPTADWGLMVEEGQASIIRGYPQESLYAGILIILFVMAVTIIGDSLIVRHQREVR